MKNLVQFWFLLFTIILGLGCGCSLSRVFSSASHSAVTESKGIENPSVPVASSSKVIPVSPAKSAKSAIAEFFSDVTKLCVTLGVLSVLAGGALIYFGLVIPGVKCIVGGVAVPVFAIWVDYHYGLVLWFLCVGSAIGFLWALNKYDPQLAKKLLADSKAALASAENEILTLKKNL